MTEALDQTMDPAGLYKPPLSPNEEFYDGGAYLSSSMKPWCFNFYLNLVFDPSSNAVFNTADDFSRNPMPPLADGSNTIYPPDTEQMNLSMLNLDPLAHAAPQHAHSTSTSNLPVNISPTGSDMAQTIIEPSELMLPTQVPIRIADHETSQQHPEDLLSKRRLKKRGRKRKGPLSPAAEKRKRKKCLERNCLAANQCRQRKKQYISNLEEKIVGLQKAKTDLRSEKEDLMKRINDMTEILLGCGNCAPGMDINWLAEGTRN